MTQERSVDLIVREATEWFTRLREGDLPQAERELFARWLAESPVHVREYLGVADTFGALSAAKAWPAENGAELVAAARCATNVVHLRDASGEVARKRSRLPVWFAVAVSVAMVALLAVLAPGARTWWAGIAGDEYITARGEQRSIVLEDGSVVQVNTLTRLVVRFDGRRRHVELADGEAFFRVAHDAARPFEVTTPLATVRALGTEFNVYSRDRGTRVAVVAGRVQVTSASGSGVAETPEVIALGPQETVRIEADGRVARARVSEPEQASAWRQRRLAFENERLDTVAAEFNRYGTRRIEIASPSLAALRITGVFDADDPGALIRYLERVQHAKAVHEGDLTVVREN